ncbi:MAG: peptidylprolyl isomerase [Bacteroidota bacterium]|nr:peptidylprolyl isomerase [Bacteroidota bacterium]
MIEQIRNRQGLLLAMIGIGMLGFLVPYDAVLALMGQGNTRDVGSVDGESISALDYRMEVDERRRLGFSGDQLQDEVWADLTANIVLDDTYDALGLEVTDAEFQEMLFGDLDSPYMGRAFYSNGENKAFWQQSFGAMLSTDEGKLNLLSYKRLILAKRKKEKMDALLADALYTNSLEGKYEYINAEKKAEIKYVAKLYKNINDDEVSVSDSDVKRYYNAHKNDPKFQQTEGRDISYVKIPVGASESDIKAMEVEMETTAEDWADADDAEAFAQAANGGREDIRNLRLAQVELDVNEAKFFSEAPGTIVGPYTKNGQMQLAQVIGRTMVPDEAAKCRHILLTAKDAKDAEEMAELGARADSLKRVLRNGGDFDDLVQRFSGDPGSKATGGVYDFFPKGRMVKPFEDFCFDKPIGALGWVETTYGVHLIEVLDRRSEVEEARVAFITKPVSASAGTAREAYAMASEFAINATDKESLMAAAADAGYATGEANSIAPAARSIAGVRDAAEIVSWAYRSEAGEVSNPILTPDFYIVVHLDAATKAGVPELESVRDEMREGAINEAKGELYAEKMDGANLEDIAAAVGETVKTGRDLSIKFPTVRGSGASTEPKVAGAALAIPVGSMSSPIVGTHGVWVIAPQNVTEAGSKDSYLEEQSTLASRARTNFPFTVLNTMQKAAGVEDNRRQQN